MSPANVFTVELLSALATPRKAALRLGLSFLIGAPFVLAAMPLKVRVAGLVMLALFHSLFGAAVGLVRDRSEGRWGWLLTLPLTRGGIILDRTLAGSLVDLGQSGPLLFLFWALHGAGQGPAALAGLLLIFWVTVALFNLLGLLLGGLVRSNAEVHLGGALCVGLVALFSGLIPMPESLNSVVGVVVVFSPAAHLAGFLESLAKGSGPGLDPAWLAAGLLLAVAVLLRALNLGGRTRG